MIVFVFASLYLACAALIVHVVWQDRRRGAARTPPAANDPRTTQAHTLVFRTHV